MQVLQNRKRDNFKFLFKIQNLYGKFKNTYVGIRSEVKEDKHVIQKFVQSSNDKDIEMMLGVGYDGKFPLDCTDMKNQFNMAFNGNFQFANIKHDQEENLEVTSNVESFFEQPDENKGLVAEIESQKIDLQKEINELKYHIEGLQNQNKSIQEDNLASKKKISELEKQIDKYKQREKAENIYKRYMDKKNKTNDNSKKEIMDLKKQHLKELEQVKAIYDKKLEQTSVSKNQDHKKQLSLIKEENMMLKIKLETQLTLVKRQAGDNSLLQERIAKLEEMNKQLESELKQIMIQKIKPKLKRPVLKVSSDVPDDNDVKKEMLKNLVKNRLQQLKEENNHKENKNSFTMSTPSLLDTKKEYISSIPIYKQNKIQSLLSKLTGKAEDEVLLTDLSLERIKVFETLVDQQ